MKTNEEFTESVYDKSRKIIAHRRNVRTKVITSLSTFSIIIILMTGIYTAIKDYNNPSYDSLFESKIEDENYTAEMNEVAPDLSVSENCTSLSGTYIDVSCESSHYNEKITDEAAVMRLTEWINKLVEEKKNIDNSTFVITIHNENGENVIYLPDEESFFTDYQDAID